MPVFAWVGFLLFVAVMVLLDLGVFHRKNQAMKINEALAWSGFWIALAIAFNIVIYFLYDQRHQSLDGGVSVMSGWEAATQFITGYVLEKSLSIDNIFVIALIFSYFRIPHANQHRLLFWGILGAVVLRGVMIALGSALIAEFEWIIYVFAALLLASAVKLLFSSDEGPNPEGSPLVRLFRRFIPVTPELHGSSYMIRIDGRLFATPMLLALLLIESSDIMFAVDSIPAVFAVTKDPFIVFTSNVFAILGLRSLYFVLAGAMEHFRYLKASLVVVLAFVGVKMLLSHHFPIPNLLSLAIIGSILCFGMLASMWTAQQQGQFASRLRESVPTEDTFPEVTDRHLGAVVEPITVPVDNLGSRRIR